MQNHPATDLFPMMTDVELSELAQDIKQNGQLEPIVLHQGAILDGRNRWRACELAGVPPATIEWTPNGHSPTVWVISKNLHRRHLTPSQKAAIAVDVLPLLEAEAKERQRGGPGGALLSEKIQKAEPVHAAERAATMLGVNPHYVADAKKLKTTAPDLYRDVRSGDKTITEAKRELKERDRELIREQNRELVETTLPVTVAVEGQRYQTIVVDPPWDWGDEGDCDQYGRARPTYATMPIGDIAALPVPELTCDSAHIYLWITNRSLPKGFALLERWGFRYVTMLTWIKPHYGMGNYFRGSTEHILFGVRGSLPLLRNDVGTHFLAPRPGVHSSKPPEFYELIETCSPGPWLEMFSRQPRPGWVAWGAEA